MKINELNNLDFGDDEWIYQKDLRLLQELIVVLNHFSKEFQSETLVKKIKFIKKTNSDILRKVFLSPEGRQYITLCYLAIKFNDSNPIVKNYSNWVNIDSANILQYLISRLDLFIVSIKILLRDNESINCSFKLPPTGIIPGTHYGWNIMNNDDDLIANKFDLYLDFNINDIQLFKLDGEELVLIDSFAINTKSNDYFFEIPNSKKYPISIDIFSQVALINFNGREQLERYTSIDSHKKYYPHKELFNQIEVLEKALDYIKISCPSLINYFLNIDNSFVPLVPPGGALPSSSNSSIDTMYWYSVSKSPLLVAEMIIHEYSHQKLFRLQDIDPLINKDKHGSGWEDCKIYSPWRDDPRPINGVFHGFVVFSEASNFWINLIEKGNISIEEKDIAFRRFAMLVKQLKYAHDSLKETYFTNAGENIFNYYANKVNNEFLTIVNEKKLYNLEPFFMEFHDEIMDNSKITIGEIVDSHRFTWLEKNKN